uniref:Uncharacterized protein n=1 Tax=Eutreptiella gymnastica TaxID=73025 RepID=A0A7S4G8Z9_9EUGL
MPPTPPRHRGTKRPDRKADIPHVCQGNSMDSGACPGHGERGIWVSLATDHPHNLKFVLDRPLTRFAVECLSILAALTEVPTDVPLPVVCFSYQCHVDMSIKLPLWAEAGWIHHDHGRQPPTRLVTGTSK